METRTPDLVGEKDDPAEEFLRLACLTYGADDPDRRTRAAAMLPVPVDVRVAAACADVPALATLLAGDPGLAAAAGGPYGWPPLLYLAYARHDPHVTESAVVGAARLLLEHGADPGAGYLWHGLEPAFTALTGAFGEGEGGPRLQPRHPHGDALARVLLEAGAGAADGQTLYNRMFRRADDHLTLLLEHGLADPGLLAEQLAWAVMHGFDDRVWLLATHRVDLDAPLTAWGAGGLRAYDLALREGHTATASLLLELGATGDPLDPAQAAAAAVLVGEDAEVGPARERWPGLVLLAASRGSAAGVRRAVALGWDPSYVVDGRTALHEAAFHGDVAVIEALLDGGADPLVRDAEHGGTPAEWAGFFGQADAAALLAR